MLLKITIPKQDYSNEIRVDTEESQDIVVEVISYQSDKDWQAWHLNFMYIKTVYHSLYGNIIHGSLEKTNKFILRITFKDNNGKEFSRLCTVSHVEVVQDFPQPTNIQE